MFHVGRASIALSSIDGYLLSLVADPSAWAALVALIAMEVVLGIDNLIFIAILTNRVPENQRETARRVGLAGALLLRLALLATVAIIVKLTMPVFSILGKGFSWRDLILIAGGLFSSGKPPRKSIIASIPIRETTCSHPGAASRLWCRCWTNPAA